MGRSSVYGVGVNDWHTVCFYINKDGKKKPIKEVLLWRAMLSRCYSEYTKSVRPTYKGVCCEDSWLYMSRFISDVSQLHGYENAFTDDWVLDKDILVKGNKLYSKETCCFVPKEANGCFTLRTQHRGSYPIGVSKKENGRFVARCGHNGKRVVIGTFDTVEEAFDAYRLTKKKEILRLAEKYKGVVDDRVYQALLNYEISIED